MAGLRDNLTGHYAVLPDEADFELVLGRNPEQCDIAVPIHRDRKTKTVEEIAEEVHRSACNFVFSKGISKRHAKIVRRKGIDYICDMGSSNGTTKSDENIREWPVELTEVSEEIKLGNYPIVYVNLDENSDKFKEYAKRVGIREVFRVGERK